YSSGQACRLDPVRTVTHAALSLGAIVPRFDDCFEKGWGDGGGHLNRTPVPSGHRVPTVFCKYEMLTLIDHRDRDDKLSPDVAFLAELRSYLPYVSDSIGSGFHLRVVNVTEIGPDHHDP